MRWARKSKIVFVGNFAEGFAEYDTDRGVVMNFMQKKVKFDTGPEIARLAGLFDLHSFVCYKARTRTDIEWDLIISRYIKKFNK